MYTLEFPKDFSDFAWEVEAKGWLQGVIAVIAGRRYRIVFYDPARLAQDVEGELRNGAVFFEPNLLVVPAVTRDCMEAAISVIARTEGYKRMMAEEAGRES